MIMQEKSMTPPSASRTPPHAKRGEANDYDLFGLIKNFSPVARLL